MVRPSSVRAAELLRLVHDRPGISRVDAARLLAVGSGATTELVSGLVAGRLIAERPAPPSGGRGRPTTVLGPHPAGPLVLAVSVTYAAWRVRAVEIGGAVVDSAGATRRGQAVGAVMAGIAETLDRMRGSFGARVRGVGVSVPGIVRGGRLVEAAMLGWREVDLTTLARPGEVFVTGNDATFAAAAESSRGHAAGSTMALHVRVDAGLGGGVVDRGYTVKGATGVAGEFGHLPFGDPSVRCPCGAFGCWGASIDGTGVARLLGVPEPPDSVAFFREVARRAGAGDAEAGAVMAVVSGQLGRGIAGLVNGLDPDVVTVGGLAALMLELAGDRVEHDYRAGLMAFRRGTAPPILSSALGEDGPLTGAAQETWTELWGLLVSRRPPVAAADGRPVPSRRVEPARDHSWP